MNANDKRLIQDTWQAVIPIADTAIGLFYQRLFEIDPGLEPLFAQVDMKQQRRKLAQALTTVVASLDDLEGLLPRLEALGRRHAGYGAEPRHYRSVGAALIWTLERGLGDAFTAAARAAWVEAYELVSRVMREAADTEHSASAERYTVQVEMA